MNRHEPPSLEQRIAATLANENAGSELLVELIREVEQAAATAEETAEQERAKAIDLIAAPDAKAAHAAVVDAELTRDRLRAVLPKLRAKLSEALRAEATERWLADYSRVAERRDQAAAAFRRYPELAGEIAGIFSLAEAVDKEISRINGSAPDGVHHRLRGVELTARDLQQFTRDNPSLSQTVELRDWDNSGRKQWPERSSGSLAAAYAQSTAAPYHPGGRWVDADIQQQRRTEAEREQQRLAEHYAQATEQQESRLNREERERFGLRP